MDKENLNQWLTLVANLAVVAGILFLAVEVRQNSILQERQMQMERVSSLIEPFFASPELGKVWTKVKAVDGLEPVAAAFIDRYELTPEEAALWSRLVHSVWYTQHTHFETDGPSVELENSIRGLLQYPDVRIVYEINEDSALTPEFVEYVDLIISKERAE